MTSSEGERRLAAIMYTDIVGYTSLTQKDEALAMQLLEEHRRLVRPFFPKHNGREIKTVGDEFLVEFASALEAVRCAFDIQQSMHEMNNGRLPEKQVQLRIGVHVGDVIHSQNDVYGDAVNVASRIEPLAMPGGICISEQVYDHVKNKFEFPLTSIGKRELKNVGEPMEVYKVVMPWEQSTTVETPSFATNRIAILPFVSMSTSPDDAFFADGMTEEIISTVSGISGLKVISRTSVMGYKGTTKKIEEIGRELKVGSVLEGSFRKAGNRIRVTTQLINVADDEHLWAQNYDRNLDDIFEVQSDVAKQVAEALRIRILSPEKERIEKKPTESAAAYTLYLKGRYLWNKRGFEDLKSARECFEESVREDPNFALGYVGLADCCLMLADNWVDEPAANLARAQEMAARAKALDDNLSEVHATMGNMLMQQYKPKEAEEEYQRAIELKPSNASAHQWYGQALVNLQLWKEAEGQIKSALELDPLSMIINHAYGEYFYWKRDYEKALAIFERSFELGDPWSHRWKGRCYGRMRDFDSMDREWAFDAGQHADLPLAKVFNAAFRAYCRGDVEAVKQALPALEAHNDERGYYVAYNAAGLHFFIGEETDGFEWLEKALSRGERAALTCLACDPYFDDVRTDPRYLDLLKRLGLDQTSKHA